MGKFRQGNSKATTTSAKCALLSVEKSNCATRGSNKGVSQPEIATVIAFMYICMYRQSVSFAWFDMKQQIKCYDLVAMLCMGWVLGVFDVVCRWMRRGRVVLRLGVWW